MANKLDQVTNREWEEHRSSLSESPSLKTFVTFLCNRADLLETLEESKALKPGGSYSNNNKPRSFVVSTEQRPRRPLSCPMCLQEHLLYMCPEFKCLPVEMRIKKAQTFKVCLNCLRLGHNISRCRLGPCNYCTENHNTLLHVDKDSNLGPMPNVALSVNHSTDSRIVLLSTAIVKVEDAMGNRHAARVLLDNGSTANFITEDLSRQLQLNTFQTRSKIVGINLQTSDCSQACSISLRSFNGDPDYKVDIECLVLPKISSSIPSAYINIKNIPIPSDIRLADPNFHDPSCIDILVGAEVFWDIIGANRIHLGKNKPTLFESKLGWLISGVVHEPNSSPRICMFTHELHAELTRFWELDSISSKHQFTAEERSCEQQFMDTTYRNADKRFVVNIPFNESPSVLGDSYTMARRRFLSLERRLDRNPELKKSYAGFLNEYIELGHMTKNTGCSLPTFSYYLPHHGVLKESSTTTKLRVVFDASARTSSGKSFNDIQMVGPTLQDDLLSILLRFRQHKIVISADIEKMYRQTLVNDAHRPLQQILWREEPNSPIERFTLNTLTYGTASAAFLATRCLIQLARECSDPSIQFTIAHDFYVDDYLSGSSTVEQAISQCRKVIAVLQSARYNLRKWQSNSLEVLQAISETSKTSDSVNLSDNEMSKTLGLSWKCLSDTFTFSIDLPSTDTVSKRQILSVIAQIFDPVGLVVPCVVEAKIIMQKLWLVKSSWDDAVPEHVQSAWNDFQSTLPLLNNLQIPRWVVCDSACCLQLHVFTDASELAYGACVYVRSVSENGMVSVHLLTAKSKVAPIKPTTIPRLELCGALLGTRLYSKVRQSLTLNIDESVFWCDSTIVIGWLSASPTALRAFVRHRVSEIQEAGTNWRYVPSQQNPADLASRGLRADKLSSSSLWWNGPQFLLKAPTLWPQFPVNGIREISSLPEMVTSLHVETGAEPDNHMAGFASRYSDMNKLQRVMAYVLRFISKCRKHLSSCGPLNASELDNAMKTVVRLSQQVSFTAEYDLLKSGQPLPGKNKLLSLSPFLDADHIIRVGGRLNNSFYDYNVKHPILLSSSHDLCRLIFGKFHHELKHAGPQLLLSAIHHHYWPIGGRNLAKKIVHQCVRCCRIKANTIQPIMGNLPEQRLHLEFPFLNTGVDYAGPIMIADRKGRGCRLIKSFICVFVCLATRAVHLELVSDLTKEAFLATMNRFIARRGKPCNIFSDNGTTFVGAFNELAHLLSQDLHLSSIDPAINFSFIPAYTPHFGGIWESAVKSTKHHLKRTLGLTNLTFEEMATCLIQIEAILNSRPLTPLSNDPSDLTPLTPAHFLIGRSLIMLPHPQIHSANVNSLQRFRRIEYLKQHFWTRFSDEYVIWLQQRTKWRQSSGELKEGTLVIIKDKTLHPLMWLMGRIIKVFPGKDCVTRVAEIRTRKGVIRRAFNTICPLPITAVEDTSTGGVCQVNGLLRNGVNGAPQASLTASSTQPQS